MDAKNKEFNGAINKMKSDELNLKRQRESNDLMNKMKRDKLNLERQKEIYASDQTDKTDQINEDYLELIKAKLALGDLKPLKPIDLLIPDLSISRPPDIPIKAIKPIKPFEPKKLANEEIQDTLSSIEKNTGAGERFAISVKELEIENAYKDIIILDDKLENKNLTLAEYKKIIGNIDQLKKVYRKKNKNYMSLKKV